MYDATDLFYRHHDLHGVQAVQPEVVGKVRVGRKLCLRQHPGIIFLLLCRPYLRGVGDLMGY